MQAVLAPYSISISEFKKNPGAMLKRASGAPMAVLSHNAPAFYAVPPEVMARIAEQLDEQAFTALIQKRRASAKAGKFVEVSIDEL
jgi:antitoxin StbD